MSNTQMLSAATIVMERKSEGNITMLATEFKKDKPNADAK